MRITPAVHVHAQCVLLWQIPIWVALEGISTSMILIGRGIVNLRIFLKDLLSFSTARMSTIIILINFSLLWLLSIHLPSYYHFIYYYPSNKMLKLYLYCVCIIYLLCTLSYRAVILRYITDGLHKLHCINPERSNGWFTKFCSAMFMIISFIYWCITILFTLVHSIWYIALYYPYYNP